MRRTWVLSPLGIRDDGIVLGFLCLNLHLRRSLVLYDVFQSSVMSVIIVVGFSSFRSGTSHPMSLR